MGQNNSSENWNDLIDLNTKIELKINNESYQVPKNINPETTLNYFIRNNAKLKGTKYMCLEGGCGVCIVGVILNDQIFSVNSCLVPIFLCNGWQVITIEGIGGKFEGYNTLQSALAEANGSQCGYCSPAMVMNMHCLVERGKTTKEDIENSFGSNICRCTGYRSILNAFQMFATNAVSKPLTDFNDIEDLHKTLTFPKNCKSCKNNYKDFETIITDELKPFYLQLSNAEFFKVFSVSQVFAIFEKYPDSTYILNGGNTGNGVYRITKKDLYIDINSIHDLHNVEKTDSTLTLGGNVTLEVAKEVFYKYSTHDGFKYLKQLADHIDLIGHVSMRNIGTLAGNLMLKHEHHDFPSDLFLILETVGSTLHILESETSKISLTFINFLTTNMKHKIIYSILLPKLNNEYVYRSYKIMPRAQNAHANVNAGFLFKLTEQTIVLEKPNIIFGAISPKFFHALKTETFLIGKKLLDNSVLKEALNILDSELNPDYVLPDPKPEYRKLLAQTLFYKFILSLNPDILDARLRSGATILERGISSGNVNYNTDRSTWPVNEPIQKLEALHQTSGEAEYVNDIPIQDNELFSVIAIAEEPGKIKSIDASEAMKMDGFVAFYTAKDIPSQNISIDSKKPLLGIVADEPLFADKEVLFAGQFYGILVAKSEYDAYEAVKRVKIIYVNGPRKRALTTIKDVMNSSDKTRIVDSMAETAKKPPGTDVKYVVKGEFESNTQYHYTMEPQTCLSIPIEDGFDIFVTTQSPDFIQHHVAICLGIPENSINLKVRRLGGAYGAKITRATAVACACSVAAYNLNRPVRLVMRIEDMMKAIGKRNATLTQYEVGINDAGKIQYANIDFYTNAGSTYNDIFNIFTLDLVKNCYDFSTWNIKTRNVRTDIPSNTWCRAPGSMEGLAIIENIMEHITKVTQKDPVKIRLENLNADDKDSVQTMLDDIIKTSDYERRRKLVESFNKYNRWKKKGIALVIMKYSVLFYGPYYALVSIYARDGTVCITHGGIEMGQGINTKVAQVAAYTLGIDIDLISIKPTTNLTSPNNQVSGGSITSDCCASATIAACNELLKRLEPIKIKLNNPPWKELVYQALLLGIDLCAINACNPVVGDIPQNYVVYGATVAEIEADMLTGQYIVDRVDIIEDTGVSLNPVLDVGQIEGAFIMGQGSWTSEELIYDPKIGGLTNYRTWNYKPPGAKDIPVDFRVSFLRNSSNPNGVLRSKATGEPAVCMSYVIPIAIRNALESARKEAKNFDNWYELNGPYTFETTLMGSLTRKENMYIDFC